MTNKYRAVMDLINTCPLVGHSTFFNVTDETNNDGNTSLLTTPDGTLVKKYIGGEKLKRFSCEIRQVKPLTFSENSNQNIEQIQLVQEFLNWINEQGEKGNFPDFGEGCAVQSMSTPEGADVPSVIGISEDGALYAFPFEITYLEN